MLHMTRRSIVSVVALVVVAAACGSDSDKSSTTDGSASGFDLSGGAVFSGTFATGPGVGPGEISFVLDESGERIVRAVINPALDSFACPTGVLISGGGITGTYTPGIVIIDGSFDNGDWNGVFDSSTEAHGKYSLQDSFDCPYEVAWTATLG
ncbi:MAG: hypothetical protein Q7V57_19065 [Actinomycetota bacterium]|nr:hypothetical protein [Actinomycetota bacterium]